MTKMNIGEVELTSAGISNGGKEKLKAEITLADGSRCYVTVYRVAAVAKPAVAVAPTIRKGKVVQPDGGHAAVLAGLAESLTPEKIALLAKVLGGLKAGEEKAAPAAK